MIITSREWNKILELRHSSISEVSLEVDFGLRKVKVKFINGNVKIGRFILKLDTKIKDNYCYLVRNNQVLPIAFFDKNKNIFYRLIPTQDWPSLSLGSVPMHRVKNYSPLQDAQSKIRLLKPEGIVLDTCMGLGYTAILASQYARRVYTFEKDSNVIFIAKLNPISKRLFKMPNIIFKKADIFVEIDKFSSHSFHAIIHDPPTFKLTPYLYSVEFYKKLYRVLKHGGRIYHYCPLPERSKGKDFRKVLCANLRLAGFSKVIFDTNSQGFLVQK